MMNTRPLAILYRFLTGLALVSVLSLGQVSQASASTIIYVKYNAPGSNNGTSWTNAYKSLQSALSATTSGDQIWVAAGTYKPTALRVSGVPRSATFRLKNGVAIYGGFAGTETSLSQRKPSVNLTILSGDIGTAGNSGDNSYHVVWGSGTNKTAVLDGFSIKAGNANSGEFPDTSGGGMYNAGGSPTLGNLTFSGNSAANGGGMYNVSASEPALNNVIFSSNSATNGGGIFNSASSPILTNVTFNNNTATQFGGGMENSNGSSPTLTRVTFAGNHAYIGGGLCNEHGSNPKLTNATFTGNVSGHFGGGMYSFFSNPTVTNATFSGNTSLDGAGMYNEHFSNTTLTNVTFSANSATQNGAGMYNYNSSPTLTRVTFSGNSATGNSGGMANNASSSPKLIQVKFSSNTAGTYGGGITNVDSSPTLAGVTFNGNSAANGGGMYSTISSPVLTNVTFSGNTAQYGGGMYNYNNSSPKLTNVTFSGNSGSANVGAMFNNRSSNPLIYDSIFWANTGGEIVNANSSTPTIANSLVQGGCAPATCINANPVLGPLQNNDGFTETMALGSGSAAIDRGSNTTCAATDQRGVGRPQGLACDIGAYEVRAVAFFSAATYDGWVLESGKNTNLGGSVNTTDTTLLVGDDASNRRYRGFVSFDTSLLPDGATIVLAKLQVLRQSIVGNPFSTQGTLIGDLVKPYFGTGLTLVNSDWQASATVTPAGTFSPVSGGWYMATLNSAGRASINKIGATQFRLRFTTDAYNNAADYLAFYSGNYATNQSFRPKLVVYYNP